MKQLLILFTAVLIVFGTALGAYAQEATLEPTAVAQVVEEVLNEQSRSVEWEELGVILSLVVSAAATVVSVIVWRRKNPKATLQQLDQIGAERVSMLELNRQWVAHMESHYKETGDQMRVLLDTTIAVIDLASGITGSKTLDALRRLAEDIQNEGDPDDLPITPPEED